MEAKSLKSSRFKMSYSTPQIDWVSIVAIHGLDISKYSVHAMDTWRKPSGAAGNLWLRDDLPQRLPLARVFVFTYDSTHTYTPAKHIRQATELLEALAFRRDQVSMFHSHAPTTAN